MVGGVGWGGAAMGEAGAGEIILRRVRLSLLAGCNRDTPALRAAPGASPGDLGASLHGSRPSAGILEQQWALH